ncbi:ferredoxin reductase family protein [Ahrensia marina]|uniref:ferredoxin reductase family protein n=1 Tax=Ahrensia marina TaxID=1514904 RepID=UPI0035CF5FC2
MRPLGLLIVALAMLAPLVAYMPLAARYDVIPLISQYIGIVALIAMAFAQILATRLAGLEMIFGGLDRIYVLHKWLGIGGLAAVLIHDTIDADLPALGRETRLHDFAETLGEVSLYGLVALVLITIVTFIPYNLWRWTHKLMGAFFVASVAHYALIMKPISNTDPLGLGILIVCGLGVVSWVYALLPYGLFQGRTAYRVADIDKEGSSLAVTLEPKGKGIVHQAGQFAFVRFGHEGVAETHPFTISKSPDEDRLLRFTVKALGDDTRNFARRLAVGQDARVSRAYGHFRAYKGDKPSVWIAAGVGITPFAAFAGELKDHKGNVHLAYCVREEGDAAHLNELREAEERYPNFKVHLFESGKGQRLTTDSLAERVDVDWHQARVAYCGPESLRETLRKGLVGRGLKRRHFAFEAFEIRSGIGIRKMVSWFLKRFGLNSGPLSSVIALARR